MTNDGRIDVRLHFSPPFYSQEVNKTTHRATDRWSVEAALAYMRNYAVAAGILSVSSPSVNFLSAAESVTMARRLNVAAAAVVRDHPTRFGTLATLPMLDVEASLREIEFCFDALHVDGVSMMSNVVGRYLGHDSFAPIFDELNRRKAVVLVQPTDSMNTGEIRMAPVAEWPFDTCRAAIDLLYSGTLRRCPDLRIILAHGGGALPMVAQRVAEMALAYAPNSPPVTMSETVAGIKSFYYDLAISAHENVVGALRGVSSLDHVLFACDWPFAPDHAIEMNVRGFESLNLSSAERRAIERGNATQLFPRLMSAQVDLGQRIDGRHNRGFYEKADYR